LLENQGCLFLRDLLGKHPYDSDISMLMRYDVPLATNVVTTELILTEILGENE